MLAAKQFFKAGFEILVRKEEQNAGKNFEFTARLSLDLVNVEVKALTAPYFAENIIMNALNYARKQLPNNAPSVIFCVLPPSWVEEPTNWNNALPPIAARFLRGTERVNALIFWAERHVEYPEADSSAWMLVRQSFRNERARIPTRIIDFLFGGVPAVQFSEEASSPDGLERLRRKSLEKEFYNWVDYLLPERHRPVLFSGTC